jgi:hypothetical protein
MDLPQSPFYIQNRETCYKDQSNVGFDCLIKSKCLISLYLFLDSQDSGDKTHVLVLHSSYLSLFTLRLVNAYFRYYTNI